MVSGGSDGKFTRVFGPSRLVVSRDTDGEFSEVTCLSAAAAVLIPADDLSVELVVILAAAGATARLPIPFRARRPDADPLIGDAFDVCES